MMKRRQMIAALVLSLPATWFLAGPGMMKWAKADPPGNSSQNQSLAGLLFRYWDWYYKTSPNFGNDPQAASNRFGNVQFMPIDMDKFGKPYTIGGITYYVGYKSVTLRPDTGFVLPFLTFNGELYQDFVPIDVDPTGAWPLSSITSGYVKATIDGVTVLDSAVDDLRNYSSGPTYFRSPIFYGTDPQYRYPVWLTAATASPVPGYAIAAVWAEGVGYSSPPLAVGTHKLHLISAFNDPRFPFGYDNTWTITVPAKGKK